VFRYALLDVGLLIAAGFAGYRSGDPGTGDSASIGTGLSYHYLPAVPKWGLLFPTPHNEHASPSHQPRTGRIVISSGVFRTTANYCSDK
jgi:hypothetical protein